MGRKQKSLKRDVEGAGLALMIAGSILYLGSAILPEDKEINDPKWIEVTTE